MEIDRRMLDFIVGLDREFSELVEGSHLYTPTVDLNQVRLLFITCSDLYENMLDGGRLVNAL